MNCDSDSRSSTCSCLAFYCLTSIRSCSFVILRIHSKSTLIMRIDRLLLQSVISDTNCSNAIAMIISIAVVLGGDARVHNRILQRISRSRRCESSYDGLFYCCSNALFQRQSRNRLDDAEVHRRQQLLIRLFV